MHMKRKASAQWKGNLKEGKGTFSAESGVLSNVPYSFARRFENEPGTNPEELIAAAHASCFSMALSGELGKLGLTADSLDATATVTLEKTDSGFTVVESHLEVIGKVPSADAAKWQQATENAKKGCPISRLLNTKITLDARLA
jgi:osmotically inducible protein OsmC